MTLFEDLQKRFDDQTGKIASRDALLIKAASDLAHAFGPYLGISKPYWTDSYGVRKKYIQLGEVYEGAFTENTLQELRCSNGIFVCDLSVTIDGVSNSHPKSFYFPLSVQFCLDGYQFVLDDVFDPIIISSPEVALHRFEPVYNRILSSLHRELDASGILIKY